MAFDLCVIPASVVPYLSALQTRQFSITDITAHLVSEKLTREQCRLMTPDTFASSYGSSSHALHVRSSVSSEINLAITSSVSGNAPSGYTIVIQGYLNDRNSKIVLGVCVSDEPIVADASLRMFVNIEETNNVFRLRADFDGMVTQGLLDDILEQSLTSYPTTAWYNSSTKRITFKNASNTELPNMGIDASAFIKDGMVNNVVIQNGNLVVSFNTDAGKEDISIPLSSIFDSGNYYTKTQTDTQISNAIDALPTVGNATITIQKRSGTSAGNFTTNATADKTINLSLGAAADKEVDTSISSTSSTNLPTSSAVAEWVNAQIGNFVTLDTQQTITSPKTLSSGEFSTSLNISNIVVEQVPSSTSGHTSSATLASDGLYADGVSFKNSYGRATDNFLVASVSGKGGYSELTVLGGGGFTFCYKGTGETDNHCPLLIGAGSTTFDENQTLLLAKDTNTYLHVDNTTLSVKDYVERIAGSGSSKFVVANVNTPDPSGDTFIDHRPSVTSSTSGTSSGNPHYNRKNASFMFDVSELPSNGTTFEVFMPSTTFVGSVQLVYGSLNYIYPIYFRGNDNVHCPTVPQGSVLRITFYNDAFYGDFYDLADFGDEHEAYVYVGKVPVDKSGSDLYAFSGLVGIDRDTGKFSQLFNVTVTENGAGVTSPRLKENSPIYACFQGDCFAAHPKVPFGNILRIHGVYGQGTLSTNMLPFTYYPFDAGDTVDAHVVTNTVSQVAYKYFQVDNCPVYIQVESNRVLIGNPPADIPARLIGFMCSGAENAGMIRLVESADVSYMSDNEYSKTFAGVWDDSSVDKNTYSLSNVSTSLSYMSDNVLVGLSNSSSKLVPLLVDDACSGDVMINPDLDWDSPVYVLFAGYRCFSAHPMVDFRQVLKSDNGSFMFTFSPMGSETPSVADGADRKQYFGSANYPVFISDFCGSNSGYKSFCVGIPSDVNIPSSDIHWRLLGYTTSKPGYIRLTESHPFLKDFIYQTGGYVKLSEFTEKFNDPSCGDNVTPSEYVKHIQKENPEYNLTRAVQELVSNHGEDVFHIKDLNASWSTYAEELNGEVYVGLPSMTTVEFKDRVSFRTSTDKVEVAYIDRDGVYHGRVTGISSDPSLSFSEATSGTTGGTLSVSVGDKTSSSVAISPVRCARQPYVSSRNSNSSYPLVFTSDVDAGYKDLYTDTVNSLSYNPNSDTLTCPTFVGDLTGNADTATKATADASGNTITSTYGSYLRTYTRATTMYGSLSNCYIELCSKSGSSLGRVYISDVIANALRGYGGFGWGTSGVESSTEGYRTYSSYGSVGSLGLFTVNSTSHVSAGYSVAGTRLHPVDFCDYSQTSYPSSNATTGLGSADIRAVHYGSTMSGTWYVLNGYGGFPNNYAWFVIAVRVY